MSTYRPRPDQRFPGGTVCFNADRAEIDDAATARIAATIRAQLAERGRVVLGLATGSTPIGVYGRLVALARAGEISFDRVTTFNLDEYYPMSGLDPRSYRAFMDQHLFRHVGIASNRAHVLDGTVPEAATAEHAAQFDRWIEAAGGIDLQLLGIGRNGHIGFNEPSDRPVAEVLISPTRLIDLHPTTRHDAAQDFGSLELVPTQALTMGLRTILASRQILVLATGGSKAEAVARSLRGPMTAEVPGSLLQSVADRVTWLIDDEAAAGLS